MKGEKMLNDMEFIDMDLIQEAASPVPAKKRWRAVAACAAAAVLIVGAVWLCGGQRRPVASVEEPHLQHSTSATMPSEPVVTKPVATVPTTEPSEPAPLQTVSYLTLDINPSLQLAVEKGIVLNCVALNDDGERILQDLALEGMAVEDALPLVIDALIAEGYLATADHAPVLLLSSRGGENPVDLLLKATDVAKDALVKKDVETFIVTQQIEDVTTVERLAKQYNVPIGRMQYVLNILRQEAELSIEEASACTIVELFGMDIEKRLIEPPYKVGDYDEHGEKVLWVGSVESYVGYVPWEELSAEYREELAQMYTPEALAILAMPRVWTTMPNVVGLPADEALELLYSRNIAPMICYEYSQKAVDEGFAVGTCFMQDIPQGRRWHSDACVHIWILIAE